MREGFLVIGILMTDVAVLMCIVLLNNLITRVAKLEKERQDK